MKGRERTLAAAAALLLWVDLAAGDTFLSSIRPGETTREEMVSLFGTDSQDGGHSQYRGAGGIRDVLAHYDESGVLLWARVLLERDLPPGVVMLLFDGLGAVEVAPGNVFEAGEPRGGRTEQYKNAGVHLYVAGEVVSEIWLVPPAADAASLVRESRVVSQVAAQVEPQPTPAGDGPLRGLQVRSISYEYVSDSDGLSHVNFHAAIDAHGLRDHTVTMRYRLLDFDGNDIPNAGGELSHGGFADKVLHDESTWPQARGSIDLRSLTRGRVTLARLRWEALLPDMAACAETVVALVAPEAEADQRRSVTVQNIRIEPGHSDDSEGVWFYADVAATGCLGRVLSGWIILRTATGRIMSREPAYAGPDGVLSAWAQDTVRFESASWTPFRLFVPYEAFDLAGSQRHRVMVTYLAACEGVGAQAEQEVLIDMPR